MKWLYPLIVAIRKKIRSQRWCLIQSTGGPTHSIAGIWTFLIMRGREMWFSTQKKNDRGSGAGSEFSMLLEELIFHVCFTHFFSDEYLWVAMRYSWFNEYSDEWDGHMLVNVGGRILTQFIWTPSLFLCPLLTHWYFFH